MSKTITYGSGIQTAFEHVLENYDDSFIIGQGLWSPWYVGNTMVDLDKKFGKERIIDCPVSENSVTGTALGAALNGMKAIVVHPRMDFMVLASDQLVNQAAKWQSMLGGGIKIPLTIRAIINRGGEQGAQHSQALHSWYAHIPGLRVVMPAFANDARDLLIASILSNDPVLYIDDRWCADLEEEVTELQELDIKTIGPKIVKEGSDITIVGSGFTSCQALEAGKELAKDNISAEVIDCRVLNPFNPDLIIDSVKKTGKLLVLDGSWKNCGFAGEVIASVSEKFIDFKSPPRRMGLKDSPAPTSKPLEEDYYININDIVQNAKSI
jgi:acetoin:2,6-dichlorophenolindophenol oxidoreductase subunit beta